MDQPATHTKTPPLHTLEILTSPTEALPILKAVLHTIFFHRYFQPITPVSRDLADITLPAIDDVDLETLVEQRAAQLVRELGGSSTSATAQREGRGRGQIVVQFFERRRRTKGGYFGFGAHTSEEICWESWQLDVTLVVPRSETDVVKVRRAMEKSLRKCVMRILDAVGSNREGVPAITTTEGNPFPYTVTVNPKSEGWGRGGRGIF